MTEEAKATSVPKKDKQVAEIHSPKWWWVEPLVWSTRMLTALIVGVKGGRWFSLIDKVWREPVLEASWAKVKANNAYFDKLGLFHMSVAQEELRQSRQRAKH